MLSFLHLLPHLWRTIINYRLLYSKKLKHSLACATLVLLFGAANATTYPVNTYSTLTSAITSATDGDIINITANIVVTAEVSVTKALVFKGNNYTITVPVPGITDAGLQASSPSAFRVFNISASGKTITFSNLTIKGGVSSASGGAVSIATGTIVKFTSCTISNSKAASGGGLYNVGTCYLLKTHIVRNAANYGGGFLNAGGTLYMEYSDVLENRSLTTNGGGGGCENNGGGYLYINNSSFGNNQSTELGGAINNNGAYVFALNSSFTGNVAYGSYKGGAIAQNASGKTMYLVNCLFGYNYYNNTPATAAYTQDDVHAYQGTISLAYCTYTASSTSSGTITSVTGNNIHSLAADGSTNDLFTGGSLAQLTDANGSLYGTNSIFRPFLVNISGTRVPTLKTGSYALAKGCVTGFTNGSGTPAVGYKVASTWTNLVGTTASSYQVTDDETNYARAATPAAGALEKLVDNYVIMKIVATTNGTVSGGSIYGDVYPSGTSVTLTALPNTGYALTNWTYNLGGSGTVSGNPLTLTLTQSTTLTPNFAISTNYTLTYIGNGQTSGSAPAVGSYLIGTNGTASSNSGSLQRTGYTFAGWNTADNGSGTDYAVGATYSASTNAVMYAKWTSLGITLDVRLNSFSATPANNGKEVLLKWQTGTETNSDYFEIQRAENCGDNWQPVGKVGAAGNSSVAVNYAYTDKDVTAGNYCYRLKQVDKDGNFKYLTVVSVHLNGSGNTAVNVYPNPAQNTLFVTGESIRTISNIHVFNQAGQEVTQMCSVQQQSNSKFSIQVSKLATGMYYIKTAEQIQKVSVAH
ncbi:MAG: InlB B-repeat-containing protein [Chitinophagaceae bacterium]